MKYILRLTLTLLLITAVVAGLLAFVNELTAGRIDELTRQKAEQAMREVLPAQDYTPLDAALPQGVTEAYRAGDAGYVVRVAPNGFGGAIDLMVGVKADGTVNGVAVIAHSETASLGANCTREEFRAQYAGGAGPFAVGQDGGTIEALTGATVTSRAVTDGVNAAMDFVREVQGT